MKEWLLSKWETVHTSFWFVPVLMAVGAFLLSLATVGFDQRSSSVKFANSLGFVWSGGAEGARSLLSTIAGSMITVAGVVFSITIVALTLASSQFGPRLLRNFLQDAGNQVTLGTFIATFLYCILVLRTIRGQNEGSFIPFISITCGVALAIASLGVLIFFIHHVSTSIQAENLIAKIGRELCEAVEKHFPERDPGDSQEEAQRAFDRHLPPLLQVPILSNRSGYLQRINRDELLSRAEKDDFRMVLKKSPGDFVIVEGTLADVWIRPGKTDAGSNINDLTSCFGVGEQRTESQDVRYGARQLSEIAGRALSPGINDPYTAIGCIDWMTGALARIVRRWPAPVLFADKEGNIRIMESPASLDDMCAATLEPIIAYGLGSAIVARHLVKSLSRVAEYARRPADVLVLQRYRQRVASQAKVLLKDQEALAEISEAANSADNR